MKDEVFISFFLDDEPEAIAVWQAASFVPRVGEYVVVRDVPLLVQRVLWTGSVRVEIRLTPD